jgi:hypothetical protein
MCARRRCSTASAMMPGPSRRSASARRSPSPQW